MCRRKPGRDNGKKWIIRILSSFHLDFDSAMFIG